MDERRAVGPIRRGDSFQVERGDLPPLAIDLVEAVGERFQVGLGHAILELSFDAGTFQFAWVKRRIRTGDLRGLDEEAGAIASTG